MITVQNAAETNNRIYLNVKSGITKEDKNNIIKVKRLLPDGKEVIGYGNGFGGKLKSLYIRTSEYKDRAREELCLIIENKGVDYFFSTLFLSGISRSIINSLATLLEADMLDNFIYISAYQKKEKPFIALYQGHEDGSVECGIPWRYSADQYPSLRKIEINKDRTELDDTEQKEFFRNIAIQISKELTGNNFFANTKFLELSANNSSEDNNSEDNNIQYSQVIATNEAYEQEMQARAEAEARSEAFVERYFE